MVLIVGNHQMLWYLGSMAKPQAAPDSEAVPSFFSESGPGSEHVLGTEAAKGSPDPEPEFQPLSEEDTLAMQEQLEASQARESQLNEQLGASQRLVSEALGAGGSPGAAPPPQREAPLGPPPSQEMEPEKFGAWLDERDNRRDRRVASAMQGLRTEFAQNATANDLFNQYVQRFPSLADKKDFVENCATAAGCRAGDSPESIFDKTTKYLESMGVPLAAEGEAEPDEGGNLRPAGVPRVLKDVSRTAGVGRPSGRVRRKAKVVEEQPVDLLDALADEQVRLGLA